MSNLSEKQAELEVVRDKLQILNDDLENKQHEKKVELIGMQTKSMQ